MGKIRTITQTVELLREMDPETAITEKAIRSAVRENLLPHRQVGKKVLLDFDKVCQYFEGN